MFARGSLDGGGAGGRFRFRVKGSRAFAVLGLAIRLWSRFQGLGFGVWGSRFSIYWFGCDELGVEEKDSSF